MINNLQKILYKISNIAPIMIFLGISLYLQGVNIELCVFLGTVGLLASTYAVIFIKMCEKMLPVLSVKIESISSNDDIVIVYLATYLFPLIDIVWSDKGAIWIGLFIIAVIILMRINVLGFNPILLLIGYHCYKLTLSTGVSDCIMISKQKGIRNKTQIKEILRIEECLVLDSGQGGK